ncbi:MAG: peptidase M20, partial [Leadbetterella sp.]|nr:peptidase M20 [Leadbetterella sp.]
MKKLSFLSLLIFLSIKIKAQDEKNVSVQEAYKNQIATIGKDKKLQKAFDIIQSLEPQTMKDLVELTEIPAPPFMEQKRGERFMQMVKAAGADSIWKDEVGNVLALRKGKTRGKTVVL